MLCMSEDIFPEKPDNLYKMCKSPEDCANASLYTCKLHYQMVDFASLPTEEIEVNHTRLLIPKVTMDTMENEGDWKIINDVRSKLPPNLILAQHNVDDKNYGILILDKPTFLNMLTSDSLLRKEFKSI